MSINFDFRNKVIAVTGGASGIGRATVQLLAAAGARLSIADVQNPQLDCIISEIRASGGDATGYCVDVANPAQVNLWITETRQHFGQLDGAANIAAIIGTGINKNRVEEIEDNDWAHVLTVNLTGVMHCMRAQIQNLRDGGSIVNVTSVAGSMGIAKNAAYSAAKHGVVGLSRSAAKEVGDRGIRVNCVAPGRIETPLQLQAVSSLGENDTAPYSIKRKGEAKEVAELIAWLLSDSTKYISGTVELIDGCWVC
ncbi:hypothetical protein Sste5346_008107 [Sporothrix stenoceras]|uniref:Uncharacterized protein n=1 Tax=Sporothrix stenoceras TaxID=5173 RepID=A0ABR3YSB4_9PEZI